MNWISVEDRLPELGAHVLVFGPEVPVCEAYFAGGHRGHGWEQMIDKYDGPSPLMEVTHWQPLPPPPGTAPAPAGDEPPEDTGGWLWKPAPAGDALARAVDALERCGISGIYDEFRDVADAIEQMASYIKQMSPGWDERDDWNWETIPAGDALAGEALGAKLIAWAADIKNVTHWNGVRVKRVCKICNKAMVGKGFEHPDNDCLHIAAKKWQEADGE